MKFMADYGFILEAIAYSLFAVSFTTMSITSRGWDANVYFQSKGLTDHIIGADHGDFPIYIDDSEFEFSWHQITHYKALWKYLDDILIPSLLDDGHFEAEANQFIYNHYMVILGGIRIRQYRESAPSACSHQGIESQCYAHDGSEDKEPIEIKDNVFLCIW